LSSPFSNTLAALDTGSSGWGPGLVAALLLLAGWGAWGLSSEVTLYAVSERAELLSPARELTAEVDARVIRVAIALGDRVEEGQLLVQLDDSEVALRLEQAQASVVAVRAQQQAARQALDAATAAAADLGAASAAALLEAEAQVRRATALGERAARDAERSASLAAGGAASTATLERDQSEAQAQAAARESAQSAQDRARLEQRAAHSDRNARLAALEQELAALEGELARVEAAAGVHVLELQRHQVVAPVAGRVAQLATLQPGEGASRGQLVATVVPDSGLQVVAYYSQAEAVGRVLPGQRARVRLHGFPWAEFGEVRATVARTSSASEEGQVRVELEVDTPQADTPIPLQHGLSGTAEVEVEALSPARLALRTAAGAMRQASDAPP
jgi:multidrug resistance efflux pump